MQVGNRDLLHRMDSIIQITGAVSLEVWQLGGGPSGA